MTSIVLELLLAALPDSFNPSRGTLRDMEPAENSYLQQIRLLSGLSLEAVSQAVAEILVLRTEGRAAGVLIWDRDMESLSDRFWFGEGKKELSRLGDTFAGEFEPGDEVTYFLDLDDLGINLPDKLTPLICHELRDDESLIACLIVAGSDMEPAELAEKISDLPLYTAVSNAWEFSELKRENERLRSTYDEMEEKTSLLEEQTMKLIHDVTVRDTIRTKQVERDRLVYFISNVVRSYVDIQKVLDTAVEQISTTFGITRCVVLRSVDSADQLDVYEFHSEAVPSAKDLFFTESGFAFTHIALSKAVPQDLGDPDTDNQSVYDREFLRKLGIRSGLIVPLILRERVLGVLFLQDCLQPRDWSIDDISLIGSLADNLSVAIENAELHQEIARQAVTDGLTGVANRRSFNESFSREFERARRYAEPLSLVIVDLDYLKKINDTYGHKAGDDAIKEIGVLLKQSSRASDIAARYGGEEFCLLLPNTEIDMAEQLAERIRRKINDVHVEGPGTISASLGVASYPIHADDPESLFQCADEALYQAKEKGRNQVIIATPAKDKASSTENTESTALVEPILNVEQPDGINKEKETESPQAPLLDLR